MVIVGAGPVGLALALGLTRYGPRSVLVDRRDRTSERSRAPSIQTRTREIFRQWGIEDRFVDAGVLRRRMTLRSAAPGERVLLDLDFAELDEEADRAVLLVLEQVRPTLAEVRIDDERDEPWMMGIRPAWNTGKRPLSCLPSAIAKAC